MKILLVSPPTENMISNALPDIVVGERGCYPPLGLLYVAAYAEKNTDHEIEVLDTQVENIGYDKLGERIQRANPDVVGIQSMTFTQVDVIKTARIVKDIDKDIKVVLGGPHPHIFPDETITLPEVDYLVLGEGEIAFTELLKNWGNEKGLKNTKGLVFMRNGKIINTGYPELIQDLDALPLPARHLTPYKKYYSLLAKRTPITTMITSRGCPYKCLFCDRPHLGKKFRARSAKNVVGEMEECVNLGISEFLIYDDTFTVKRKRVVEICDEILARDLDVGWDVRARVDTVDKELLKRMRDAGCERIHYGVESGNPEILEVLRKRITLDKAKEVFKATKDSGILTLAYFILGSPTETKGQVMQTLDFAKKLDPDFVHFSVMTPYPATDLYRLGLENGVIKNDYWREFSKDPTPDFVALVWDEVLSREELMELLKYSYKSFYLRPRYIVKRLLGIRSSGELFRYTKGAGKLVGYTIKGNKGET